MNLIKFCDILGSYSEWRCLKMFKATYETRYGDYRDYETIKPGSVMDIIQDVSTKNSSMCGYGIFEMRDMQRAWLLKGVNLHFEKKVKTFCPIDVYTAVKPPKGATSERGCILMQNGEVVAKSIADWFLFNTEKLRPVRIPQEMLNSYETHDFEDEFFTYKKPEMADDVHVKYEIRIGNKDIDTNKHLNNQRGADLLMDALPYDFEFNDIKLLYKKPCFLGDELEVCVKEIDKGYYVHLQTKEKEICVVGNFLNI